MRVSLFLAAVCLFASTVSAGPILSANTDRPLRYHPDGEDFVIENGPEYFNRPLYIRNSAMRVDAGDRPEFSLYLPGRGGNLRLGVRIGKNLKWLNDADKIIARYRPAEMIYEIHDALLGDGTIAIKLLTLADADGYIVRVEGNGLPKDTELLFAFGGMNGDKGRRNGDIGCEVVPVSEFFAIHPEYCRDDAFEIEANKFVVKNKSMMLVGTGPKDSAIVLGDAEKWNSVGELFAGGSAKPQATMVRGSAKFEGSAPLYIVIQKQSDVSAPAKLYDDAEKRAKNLREKVVVDTPDPFINAAVSALCVAADGVWDEKQGAVMHGAVAWRVKLLGWRGPYANDVLGWHDRATRHFTYWAGQQNTSPIPTTLPSADEKANLSRNEAALHSNGDMSNSHYDMNLVYIDALFRHLMWTGDMKMAKEMWPVIQRHIAWERRLFRRTFGPENLPLYEGYCDFWASDDVAYNGGGATHASAYNYWHNRMAAKLARAIGEDPSDYDHEADLIWKAMQQLLWVKDEGCFGEWKDLLGLQLVHPAAAVWTVYHTIDSQACTPEQADQMTRYIDREIARIPIHGPGVPDEGLFTIPSSNWMPYQWSTNNVVMAEAAHTSLAYWQAGRPDDAFKLFKGCVLDSMYMGLCPGNVGMTTTFDSARGESQRDFADGVGMTSRAVVEGLFGVRPDELSGEMQIRPGFPEKWDHASIHHPDFDLSFVRKGDVDTYVIEQRFPKMMKVKLIPNSHPAIVGVTVNRQKFDLKNGVDEIDAPAEVKTEITVTRNDQILELKKDIASGTISLPPPDVRGLRFETVDVSKILNDRVTNIFKNEYRSPRSPFCSLSIPKQGIGSWCHPEMNVEIDDSGLRRVAGENGGKIELPNGIPLLTTDDKDAKNITFVSQWDNYPHEIEIPVSGSASQAILLMAGSTNSMESQFDNGEVIVNYVDGSTDRTALRNPTNWWPIEQDYMIDDYGFRRPGALPMRVNLKTGQIRVLDLPQLQRARTEIRGGAATVVMVAVNPSKHLKSLTVRALANEVVIGTMSVTLARN